MKCQEVKDRIIGIAPTLWNYQFELISLLREAEINLKVKIISIVEFDSPHKFIYLTLISYIFQ